MAVPGSAGQQDRLAACKGEQRDKDIGKDLFSSCGDRSAPSPINPSADGKAEEAGQQANQREGISLGAEDPHQPQDCRKEQKAHQLFKSFHPCPGLGHKAEKRGEGCQE